MSPRSKALLALVLSAPVLTEIVSGNTPAHALLDPRVLLFLLVAYSLPLLVIRELAVRQRLSTAGVFLLGLAYGIWNEGLLAQTLLHLQVPMPQFDRYLYAAGFNFSWSAVILPWHAFLAILFPLALVPALFPDAARQRWLGKQAFVSLASVLIALELLISILRKPHPQMLACLLAITALVSISFQFRREPVAAGKERRLLAFAFGILAYPAFIGGAIALASHRVSPAAYFTAVPAILAGLGVFARLGTLLRPPAQASLALGTYCAASLFNLGGGIARHSPEQALTGAVMAAVFLVAFAATGQGRREVASYAER